MLLQLLSTRAPSPLITCHASPAALRTRLAPPSLSPPSPPNPNPTVPTSLPSLTCALQCPHFQSCSGCTHELNLHRPVIVEEAAEFFKGLGVSDFTFDSCRLWGWRCRAKLAVRGSVESPLIGLYREGTHNVVDIPQCEAHHPNINAAVELLRQGITEMNVEPYDEDQGTGDLRYVQMAVTTYNTSLPASERYKNGKVQVALVWNSRNENSLNSDKLNALASFLWRKGGLKSNVHLVHSVWANFQTSTNNIIFGNRWRHLLGERDFWEHVGGLDISLAPSSFGQANTRAFDVLLRKLQKYVPFGASVADLYAGAGVIGLSLAATRKCRSVKCIEINKESMLSFEKTVDRLPNAVDCSITWHHADTSKEPLSWMVGCDVVIVDPPRKGLDMSLIEALQNISAAEHKAKSSVESPQSKLKDEKRPWILRAREASVQIGSKTTLENSGALPEILIYISCGWESFKEDCKSLLSSKAWHLDKAHGYNFFPGTQSIEVLAVFKRGQGEVKKKKLGKKKKKRL
ncbi:putative RNA methyltransferase pc1998 [Morella rubra]|uniref:Putative RNA methyltransferase pc1998 n=1 Tax=Morella rubra TaxID=262757 RepID=A0A6A1VL47_9ROSI|nr:putative RNA methyltransferase pc1998 [Morella rubra]